jgi:hypothetical protein
MEFSAFHARVHDRFGVGSLDAAIAELEKTPPPIKRIGLLATAEAIRPSAGDHNSRARYSCAFPSASAFNRCRSAALAKGK